MCYMLWGVFFWLLQTFIIDIVTLVGIYREGKKKLERNLVEMQFSSKLVVASFFKQILLEFSTWCILKLFSWLKVSHCNVVFHLLFCGTLDRLVDFVCNQMLKVSTKVWKLLQYFANPMHTFANQFN